MNNVINELKTYFKDNLEVLNKINTIEKDFHKKTYKIAIVANMSAGKSTFINALLKEEILPSFNESTSDNPIYIYPSDEIKAIIHKTDEIIELDENNINEIKQYALKDSLVDDEKYKNVEKIELFYPLNFSKIDEIDLVFIDTPGTNNTDEFSHKHRDYTFKVLDESDMALFLFDYSQLDANLTEEGSTLWEKIKQQKQNKEYYEIFYILNKIDLAIDDNEKIGPLQDTWYVKEKEAINKLKEAMKKHNIEGEIFPLSSKYELIKNKIHKTRRELRDYALFEEAFEEVFGSEFEAKMIEYIGFERLQNRISEYIKEVSHKIEMKTKYELLKVIESEIDLIKQQLEQLEREHQEKNLLLENEYKHKLKELEDKKSEILGKIQKIADEIKSTQPNYDNFQFSNLEDMPQWLEYLVDIVENFKNQVHSHILEPQIKDLLFELIIKIIAYIQERAEVEKKRNFKENKFHNRFKELKKEIGTIENLLNLKFDIELTQLLYYNSIIRKEGSNLIIWLSNSGLRGTIYKEELDQFFEEFNKKIDELIGDKKFHIKKEDIIKNYNQSSTGIITEKAWFGFKEKKKKVKVTSTAFKIDLDFVSRYLDTLLTQTDIASQKQEQNKEIESLKEEIENLNNEIKLLNENLHSQQKLLASETKEKQSLLNDKLTYLQTLAKKI